MSRSSQLPNLDKIFKDDEEHDFTPTGGSNLAAIFGASQQLDGRDIQQSQVQKNSSNSGKSTPKLTPQNKTEVIIAKAVHAYKLQDGQYSLIGKVGIALTGNLATQTYLLILYKNKQNHISVVTLTPNFSYDVKENNYVSYYDGNNENWSILFENSESSIEFSREICLSKYYLQTKPMDTVYYENLTPKNNNEAAADDDNILLNYFLITSISQPLQIKDKPLQSMTVQVSSYDTWEKTLAGVTKGTKRLLVLPPSKQLTLGPGFPMTKDIAMEIEIVDIIKSEEESIPSPKLPVPGGKAALISRMAKMGQSILPKVSTTDSEDTEDEIQIKSPRKIKNSSVESIQDTKKSSETIIEESSPDASITSGGMMMKNFTGSNVLGSHGAVIPAGRTYSPSWPSNTPIYERYVSTADGTFPVQTTLAHQMMPIDPNINIFLSETRTQNSEIRMGINKVADNVQKLLDKFHLIEIKNAEQPTNEKALETTLKMILSLNSEKNHLKNDNNLIDEKNCTASSTESLQLQEKIKLLEDELRITKNNLNECKSKLEHIVTVKSELITDKLEMQKKIDKLETQLSDTHTSVSNYLLNIKEANDLTLKYQNKNQELEDKIKALEVEKKLLENNDKSSEKDTTAEVKSIMNKTYQTLVNKYTEEFYPRDFIKSTIANTIKEITLQVLMDEKKNKKIADKDFALPEFNHQSSGSETNIILDSQDGPPPIPPMDLDVNDDNEDLLP
ncbi:hypothetical protein HCN44_005509 [Aphidius gifuensis]|uniref:FK506-binding protein 15 n=1 Tax=Aphidius gifuensis TaxID=684658 RepID=A0A835CV95_APHGI|nr:FK506-binding protein 15 [Aphidius gifuensis]KAF7997232.1 hypothetical protein HCN44_005509 [Aphidius gifuensis]